MTDETDYPRQLPDGYVPKAVYGRFHWWQRKRWYTVLTLDTPHHVGIIECLKKGECGHCEDDNDCPFNHAWAAPPL